MLETVSARNLLVRLIAFALLFGQAESALARFGDTSTYTDRIHLKNGDVITGDMKELDRGKLRFKTRTMDQVYINWVDIESIETNKYLRIEQADGTFNYGFIQKADLSAVLVVEDRGQEVEVPILAVSSIQPIRVQDTFWRRIEGDVKAGIDYKTASDILLINLATNFRFREEKYELNLGANWNETSRAEEDGSSRADLSGGYTRFLKNRWFWRGSAGLERNEELGLDMRTLVSATAGRYIIQKPTLRLELNAGVAGNHEERQDGTTDSVEGVIRSSLEIFKYKIPITRLTANVSVFPGITEKGRMRVNTDLSLRNEIVRDLFWELQFFSNYDNRPPEGASKEDYGIVTSIGASF
jgi:putative salt-induced outer membrane protein YdiY